MAKQPLKPLHVHIPDDLHRAAKIKAAKEGRTLQNVVVDALRKDLGRKATARGAA